MTDWEGFEEIKRDISIQSYATKSVMDLMEDILDYGEVAIGDTQRYKVFRSKVLRLGNNVIRDFQWRIDHEHELEDPTSTKPE